MEPLLAPNIDPFRQGPKRNFIVVWLVLRIMIYFCDLIKEELGGEVDNKYLIFDDSSR